MKNEWNKGDILRCLSHLREAEACTFRTVEFVRNANMPIFNNPKVRQACLAHWTRILNSTKDLISLWESRVPQG